MRIGIVGSRSRKDKESVIGLVKELDKNDIVVSGGCKGIDTWAEITAKKEGLKTDIYYPDFKDCTEYYDYCQAYYDRNEEIVKNSDVIFAFVSSDRTGGTENTIKWAEKYGVQVIIC